MAIAVYLVIGLLVGMFVYLPRSKSSSLAGLVGSGGAGGVIGGVLANLLFSDGITLDAAGLVGSVILSIVAVLAIRSRVETEAPVTEETPPSDA